ncbi:butyrophilin subfamily 1 member A1-like [Neoarius graeffei]|uniref:butyrophilin subfamily 1 member A1-like n=1 Tax=Neoarius graeffei TaxID=443677 RepID=UPI00298BCB39|nr:butyrophilin subfamily 1 member A1-like [Neoarius graeffei]
MSRRCVFFFLIQLLIDNAMVQVVETCKAVVGDTVILPCSTKPTAEIGDVFWRYEVNKVNKVVLEIIKGKENFQDQSQEYRGRVGVFSAEFAKGNFSIELRGVKLSDSGTYTCNFPKSGQEMNVQLSVKEASISPTPAPKTGDGTRRASSMFLLVCSLLYSLVF